MKGTLYVMVFVLYTAGVEKKKKKSFVQWQTRTETRFVVHSEPSGVSLEGGNAPRRSFEPVWRGLKQPHRKNK